MEAIQATHEHYYIEVERSTLNQPLLIIIAEMGLGAGYVGLFLGDQSEVRTADEDKENAEDKVK